MSGEGVPSETRELYTLIGNYERFTREVDRKLGDIEKRLRDGDKTFNKIHRLCAVNCKRLDNLEEKDVLGGATKREKLGLWGSVAMAVYVALRIIAQFFGVKLP